MNRREFLIAAGAAATTAAWPDTSAAQAQPSFRLVDVTAGAGLRFQHHNGGYGQKLLPETLGSGCAFLDYDGDGWQDILVVNGMMAAGR